ncbi:MAG: DUF4433 domain-containing protein [Phycisphaeraceae bacterium]|nr:MAG: DUF4433 domain-containing protein [Phycisphaeraceae bacterium]
MDPPNPTPIYHITHIENLRGVIDAGGLLSDARRAQGEFTAVRIGYEHIKQRRMKRRVRVASEGVLGDYVPFNFCPRSVMLHSIWRRLIDGCDASQDQIVHLVSTAQAASSSGRMWAFTDRHAEPPESNYFVDLSRLSQLRWDIIGSNNWGGDERRPFKQAEFLVHGEFPWTEVLQIGVKTEEAASAAKLLLQRSSHCPVIKVRPDWYY